MMAASRRGVLRVGLALGLVAASACKVDPFCIDCDDDDQDGGERDGPNYDAPEHPPSCDSFVREVCDGYDNDCDGLVDEEPLEQVGEPCGTEEGPCTQGTMACVDGELVCEGGVGPVAESCNGVDDDCNGVVDNGNPGGGIACGVETGICTRGVSECVDGEVICAGGMNPTDELCNGLDDDCDGDIDEGDPEGGGTCDAGPTSCSIGRQHCVGGVLHCQGVTVPGPELCDGLDNDCDGDYDEDFDLTDDSRNCGACGTTCSPAEGVGVCVASTCEIGSCNAGFTDLDGDYDNGCEYPCAISGTEACNGVDDDCDGEVDEGVTPPSICLTQGECAGVAASCDGAEGWVCHYPATVSLDEFGDVIDEGASCDDLDNDCDGVEDDYFGAKGTLCTRGLGVCTQVGELVCNGTHDGLECETAIDPPDGTDEVCNGLDDDCDGEPDDGAPDEWVTVTVGGRDVLMYAYEASRPDATTVLQGVMDHRPCSTAGRLPWTNLTNAEAEEACALVGARLCTEEEWQRGCETTHAPTCAYPYDADCDVYDADACNGNEFDSSDLLPGDQDALLPGGAMEHCVAAWTDGELFDMSGNVAEWTAARSPGVNPIRGGSYNTPELGLTCQHDFVVGSDVFLFANVGFRCCKD